MVVIEKCLLGRAGEARKRTGEPLADRITEYRELLLNGKGWKLRAMAEESEFAMEKLGQLANDKDDVVGRRAKLAIKEATEGNAKRAAFERRRGLVP